MNFECDLLSNNNESMDYTTGQTIISNKQQVTHTDSLSVSHFIISNDDYNNDSQNNNISNAFNSILNPNFNNDEDTNDSEGSIDCNNTTDFNNLNFILNSQPKYEEAGTYSPSISLNRNFTVSNTGLENNGMIQSAKTISPSLNLSTSLPNTFSNYLIERNSNFNNDYLKSTNKFQYVLMANTSPAVKVNEDTLTYLNQGQSYELKFNRIGFESDNNPKIQQQLFVKKVDNDYYKNTEQNKDDTMYLSIIRLCFWERKLQEIEHEEIKEVIICELNREISFKSYFISCN